MAHGHPLYGGALGIIGATSTNTLAAEADVVLAVGTRLQDFTTASWTLFGDDVTVVTVHAARFDAVKHNARAVVGDALAVVEELAPTLASWAALARPWTWNTTSCLGYEVAGPWGAAMAGPRTHRDGVVTTLLGDASYLTLNSDLYSAALSGHRFVAVVCDNGGYAVIHRLQTNQGANGFNNLLDDGAGPAAAAGPRVVFGAPRRRCAVIRSGRT